MKYEKINYPDGQIGVKILDIASPFIIQERINSYEDLFFIKSIVEALNNAWIEDIHLVIPCLFGQRSDRRFSSTSSFDLKIIAEFINSCHFTSVNIFDPHSDVALALINNSYKRSSLEFVSRVISEVEQNVVLISPDAGAYKKVFEYGKDLGLEVVAGVKHRSLNGEVDLKFIGDVNKKNCLIVDDLCDGGYTFIQLSRALRAQGADKVYLYVSHAYFSKGVEVMLDHINHIFCTNSVKDINAPYVTQFKII